MKTHFQEHYNHSFDMKQHRAVWIFLAIMLVLFGLMTLVTFSLAQEAVPQEQQRDTVWNTRTVIVPCACDSAFVRRVNARIDKQFDINNIMFTALKDHAQATMILERRLDSIRAVLQARLFTNPQRKR
jgi:hypothetical protein